MNRYPRQLSTGSGRRPANNAVVVLSETEVGKLFTTDTRSDIGSDGEKMRFTNEINELVVRFVRLNRHPAVDADRLVMERLYPIDFRAYEVERRDVWLGVFADKLRALHRAGFVHRYLHRPAGIGGDPYDNILLTAQGLRLIDVGISVLRHQIGDRFFGAYIEQEEVELAQFGHYFSNR